MEFEANTIDNTSILTMYGRVDSLGMGPFLLWLESVHPWALSRIVVDLSEVDFIDSRGLSMLVRLMKRAQAANGGVHLVGLRPAVRLIFEMTRFDRAFPIFDTREKALAAFRIAGIGPHKNTPAH